MLVRAAEVLDLANEIVEGGAWFVAATGFTTRRSDLQVLVLPDRESDYDEPLFLVAESAAVFLLALLQHADFPEDDEFVEAGKP